MYLFGCRDPYFQRHSSDTDIVIEKIMGFFAFFLSSLRLLLYTEMGENANGVEEEEERDITRGYIQAKEKE